MTLSRFMDGRFAIAFILALGLVLGLVLVKDYGVSWDETFEAEMGSAALKVYTGSQEYFALEALPEHGPSYYMLFSATSAAIHRYLPGWSIPDGRHLTNYLTFLFGTFWFYVLCLRLVRRNTAVMATLLFATQPLFFGSSFINQKDMPLMSIFLAVVVLGLVATEGWWGGGDQRLEQTPAAASPGSPAIWRHLGTEWEAMGVRRQRRIGLWSALVLLFLADLFFVGALHRLGQSAVVAAAQNRAFWPLQPLFDLVASDAIKTPLPLYLEKYQALFKVLRLAAIILAGAAVIIPLSLNLPSIGRVWHGSWFAPRYTVLLISAVLLGFAISIRQVGVFSGGLVSLYLLYRGRARAVLPLAIYWLVAIAAAYATWPYLWPDPFHRIVDSFQVIKEFGLHYVIFQGRIVSSSDLPWSYFPTLVMLNLTEPALILTLLGLSVSAWRSLRGKDAAVMTGLLGLWVGIPVYLLVTRHVPIYNNLRHFFFVLPPLLGFAAVGLDGLLVRLRAMPLRAAISGVSLLPGIWAIFTLHPYEYAYFNTLAGGVKGATGEYNVEYWCTSLKEATDFVNKTAAPGETLMVFGQIQNAIPYARQDLILESMYSPLPKADIVAICTDLVSGRWDPSDFQLVHEVQRRGAVFAQIWRRNQAPE